MEAALPTDPSPTTTRPPPIFPPVTPLSPLDTHRFSGCLVSDSFQEPLTSSWAFSSPALPAVSVGAGLLPDLTPVLFSGRTRLARAVSRDRGGEQLQGAAREHIPSLPNRVCLSFLVGTVGLSSSWHSRDNETC